MKLSAALLLGSVLLPAAAAATALSATARDAAEHAVAAYGEEAVTSRGPTTPRAPSSGR